MHACVLQLRSVIITTCNIYCYGLQQLYGISASMQRTDDVAEFQAAAGCTGCEHLQHGLLSLATSMHIAQLFAQRVSDQLDSSEFRGELFAMQIRHHISMIQGLRAKQSPAACHSRQYTCQSHVFLPSRCT